MTVEVAFHVRKTVLAIGIEEVLRRIPSVNARPWCASVDHIDVVIVYECDIQDLEQAGFFQQERQPKLLLVAQGEHGVSIFEHRHPPDGVLVEDELTETQLADTLQRTVNGEMPIPARLARELIGRVGAPPPVRQRGEYRLTPREAETLALLAEGLGNKQIARRLHISSHGAKRIVASLLLKLDSPNRTTAVVRAIQDGLVTVNSG